MAIKYTSIYADTDGVSHFREVEIETNPTLIGPLIPPLGATVPQPASGCHFLTFPPWDFYRLASGAAAPVSLFPGWVVRSDGQ
jgi:hypothetical protein